MFSPIEYMALVMVREGIIPENEAEALDFFDEESLCQLLQRHGITKEDLDELR